MNLTVQIVAPNGEGLRPLIRLTNNPSIKTRPFSYLLVWVIITVRSMFVQFCTFILNDRFWERLWRLLKEHRMTKTRKKVKTGRLYPIFSNDWNLEWFLINFLRHCKVFFEILPIDSSLLTVLSDFYVSVITVFNQINYFRGTSELFPSLTDLQNPFWLNFKRNSLCII